MLYEAVLQIPDNVFETIFHEKEFRVSFSNGKTGVFHIKNSIWFGQLLDEHEKEICRTKKSSNCDISSICGEWGFTDEHENHYIMEIKTEHRPKARLVRTETGHSLLDEERLILDDYLQRIRNGSISVIDAEDLTAALASKNAPCLQLMPVCDTSVRKADGTPAEETIADEIRSYLAEIMNQTLLERFENGDLHIQCLAEKDTFQTLPVVYDDNTENYHCLNEYIPYLQRTMPYTYDFEGTVYNLDTDWASSLNLSFKNRQDPVKHLMQQGMEKERTAAAGLIADYMSEKNMLDKYNFRRTM